MAFITGGKFKSVIHCTTTYVLAAAVLVGSSGVGGSVASAAPPAPNSAAAATEIRAMTQTPEPSPPPTAAPAPTPTPTPTATETPSPSASPSASLSPSPVPSPTPTVASPYLSVAGKALSNGHVTSPVTVLLSDAAAVTGEVTWLIDDKYAGKDPSAPYQWDAALPLGKHKAKARWVTSGTATSEVSSEFTVQTDLNWVAPQEIREEPGAALRNLWLTGDNRRPAEAGVYDWSKAGFGGGSVLPSDENVRPDAACRIDATQLSSGYGVVPNDGVDDTAGIQDAIDHIRTACSPTGAYTAMSRIALPAGTLNVTREIHVDADYLLIRGAGSDPATGTRLQYLPDADTRYDSLSGDGTRWNPDAMNDAEANGGWI